MFDVLSSMFGVRCSSFDVMSVVELSGCRVLLKKPQIKAVIISHFIPKKEFGKPNSIKGGKEPIP